MYQSQFFLLLSVHFIICVFAAFTMVEMSLFDAIRKSDLAYVETYLRNGGATNARNTHGSTPLHEAVYEGDNAIIRLLLAKGADVNALDGYGNSPLHVACICGRKEVARMLLDIGADVDITSEGRTWTPLMLALNERYTDLAELLIARGANLNHVESQEGWTPLLVACEQGLTAISLQLIDAGGDVNAVLTGGDSRGKSAIHLTSYYGGIEIVKALIEVGVDVNAEPQGGGLTGLHWAAYNKHIDLLEFLLESGADANIQAAGIYQDRGPLHFAVAADSAEMTRMLLEYDANPLLKDKEGTSPLDIALERNADSANGRYLPMIKLLESYI